MDVSTLLLGTVMTLLPLIGAGLLTVMVLLERPGAQLASATGPAGRAPARSRRKSGGRRQRA